MVRVSARLRFGLSVVVKVRSRVRFSNRVSVRQGLGLAFRLFSGLRVGMVRVRFKERISVMFKA